MFTSVSHNTPWTSGLSILGPIFLGTQCSPWRHENLMGLCNGFAVFSPRGKSKCVLWPWVPEGSLPPLHPSLHPSLGASGLVSPSLSAPTSLSLTNFVFPLSHPPSLPPSCQVSSVFSTSPLLSRGLPQLCTLILGLDTTREWGGGVPASEGPTPWPALSIRGFFRGGETSMTPRQASLALLILAREGSSLMD